MNFDHLPEDVKLYIFSFLSVYDAAALAEVSSKNRDMFRSIEYWRQRARLDYGRLPGKNDPSSFYRQCHADMMKELNDERGVILAIKWLMDNLTPQIVDRTPTLDQAAMLHDRDHVRRVFENRSRQEFFARFSEIRDKYAELEGLREATPEELLLLNTVSAPQTSWADIAAVLNVDPLTAARNYVGLLVNSKAVLALRIFLKKCPHDIFQQEELMKFGHAYLQVAIDYCHAEMVELLLDYGVGPNMLSENECLNIVDVPLKCVLRAGKAFMEKMDRLEVMAEFVRGDVVYEYPDDFYQFYLDGIDAFGKCIKLLLVRGADPDLPPTPDMTYQETPREMAVFSLLNLELREDLPAEIKEKLSNVLNLIINAPACAAEPVLKRLKY